MIRAIDKVLVIVGPPVVHLTPSLLLVREGRSLRIIIASLILHTIYSIQVIFDSSWLLLSTISHLRFMVASTVSILINVRSISIILTFSV